MIYSPHRLFVKVENKPTEDEFGNPIFPYEPFTWVERGRCRCDDNGQMKQISVNGAMFDFSYHVVYTGERIANGTDVKVLDEAGELRGSGKVKKSGKCNYLQYSEVWM